MEAPLRAALASGKPVVSANKVLLAEKLDELGVLAQRTATPLSCEAAVTSAIPILRHLSHRADEVESLLAIVNGTSNYLITRLEQDGLTLEAARMGLAEADPSADLDGSDAVAKLSILCYRAFGAWFAPKDLPARGIRDLQAADCRLAASLGFRIRHIARAQRQGAVLDVGVEPVLLPSWHLLASVEEEYNAVYMQCTNSGDLSLFGKGAGGLPAATAVLTDLIDLAQDNSMRWPEPRRIATADPGQRTRRHYLRVRAERRGDAVEQIKGLLGPWNLIAETVSSDADGTRMHYGFLLSASSDESFDNARSEVAKQPWVADCLGLGVIE